MTGADEPLCINCRFFKEGISEDDIGNCRRFPPVHCRPSDCGEYDLFATPQVLPGDWCGEYQPAFEHERPDDPDDGEPQPGTVVRFRRAA